MPNEHMLWTLQEAQRFLRLSAPFALRNGYVLALFGSVAASGSGRDLDVMAVAVEPRLTGPQFIANLADQLGEHVCEGTANMDGAHITWGKDRWIDMILATAAGVSVMSLPAAHRA